MAREKKTLLHAGETDVHKILALKKKKVVFLAFEEHLNSDSFFLFWWASVLNDQFSADQVNLRNQPIKGFPGTYFLYARQRKAQHTKQDWI